VILSQKVPNSSELGKNDWSETDGGSFNRPPAGYTCLHHTQNTSNNGTFCKAKGTFIKSGRGSGKHARVIRPEVMRFIEAFLNAQGESTSDQSIPTLIDKDSLVI